LELEKLKLKNKKKKNGTKDTGNISIELGIKFKKLKFQEKMVPKLVQEKLLVVIHLLRIIILEECQLIPVRFI
jgi:hypothetical protein